MESWVVSMVYGIGDSGVGGAIFVGVMPMVGDCKEDDGFCDCSM
jgi:hypothetical protein